MGDVTRLKDACVRCPTCNGEVRGFRPAVERDAFWATCFHCGAHIGLYCRVTTSGPRSARTAFTPDTVREMG